MAVHKADMTNKHHFRDHLIPEKNEGLDVGLTSQRFATGRFASLIVDTITAVSATIGTVVAAITAITATITTLVVSGAATFSWLGAGVVHTDASGVISTGSVALGSEVSGTLVVANGGTGLATITSGSYMKGNGTGNVSLQAAPIPVADGGTGGITAAAARTALGASPLDPQFVTLATNSELSNERVLTAGTGITITDAGAGSTVTISVTGGFSNPIATQVFGG